MSDDDTSFEEEDGDGDGEESDDSEENEAIDLETVSGGEKISSIVESGTAAMGSSNPITKKEKKIKATSKFKPDLSVRSQECRVISKVQHCVKLLTFLIYKYKFMKF